MKITQEQKKVLVVKELLINDNEFVDMETGEEIDIAEVLRQEYELGDIVKLQITRVIKEEE